MLLTEQRQWIDLYELIKSESRKSSEKHVHIYVSATDVDSVCALRILEVRRQKVLLLGWSANPGSFQTMIQISQTVRPLVYCLIMAFWCFIYFSVQALLQNDLIPHGWTAVSRYQEVIDDFLASYDEADPVTRFVILLNCGASEDVTALLALESRPSVCVIIFDSHRPIMHMAHDNDPSSQIFVVLDAEAEGLLLSDIPPAGYGEGYDNVGTADHADDAQESENLSDNNILGTRSPNGNRQRGGISGDPGRQEGRGNDARTLYYSQGVSYGKPSACVLYDLSYFLQADCSYFLWLALVGLTDHLVHDKVTITKYDELYLYYEGHVAAAGHLDAPALLDPMQGETSTGVTAAPTCRIVPEEDFRFGLLREWNLWEAMVNSPYVASRLHTYTEKGRQRLEFLLAKLGIPLREAKASFQYDMKPRFRLRLSEQLTMHGSAYNLADAIFKSFQLQDGFKRCVMAVDAVQAATALLESAPTRPIAGSAVALGNATNETQTTHRDRFWRAWNALSWRDDAGELRKGIELAKKVQRALVADGGSVIVQRLYHNFRSFRIFDLSDHKFTHYSLLARPMALQRLAAFFQEQHLHQNQNNRRKPVVLIGPKDPISGRCLAVGYQISNPGKGNRLGEAFEAAAEEVGAQAWHDLFDTTVMEIATEDVERFKGELLRVATELL